MFSRQIDKTPKSIIENGKINFGTYKKITNFLDIKDVKKPFACLPFPPIFSNLVIKSRIAYMFNIENYIGMVEFFDDKIFGLAEVIIWNKETGQKFAYHTMMATRKRIVPTNTQKASCASYKKTRNIKIKWNRQTKQLYLKFLVKGDRYRPSAKGIFVSNFSTTEQEELLTVCPAPTFSRCSASWHIPLQINGGIQTAKHKKDLKEIQEKQGLSLMIMNRTYLKLYSKSEMMCGLIKLNGQDIIFRFTNTSQDGINTDTYNDNILSINNKITPMPSVYITHPFGTNNKWVVQDTENMVDLVFHPISSNNRTLNILVLRNVYTVIYGTFEGVLVNENGEKIILKNCPGIVKKNFLRL